MHPSHKIVITILKNGLGSTTLQQNADVTLPIKKRDFSIHLLDFLNPFICHHFTAVV